MAVQIICGIHSWKNVGASEEALLGLPELIMSVFLCTLAFLQEKNEIK
jgi:hypothetical protein